MDQKISFVVDGKPATVSADPAMPLLYALHSELGLNNPKFGCGKAQCGACTVHVDGQPQRACVTPLAAVQDKAVRTIESLGTRARPHPLQVAWATYQVPQCGYCQSGVLMAAAALLEANRNPSDAEIDAAITNLCRCGTTVRMRDAIKSAARLMPITVKRAAG